MTLQWYWLIPTFLVGFGCGMGLAFYAIFNTPGK